MSPKTIIIFAISIALCTLAATYRFHDSAHAMGVIKKGGGVARHPAQLDAERSAASLIVTAKVAPPYQGDARVVLEGAPGYSYAIHNSEPAIRLPFHHRPTFLNSVFQDLRPNDRVALWVVINKRPTIPAEPHQHAESDTSGSCCELNQEQGAATEMKPGGRPGGKGAMLAFYDTRSNERLLAVPIRFIGTGGGRHAE